MSWVRRAVSTLAAPWPACLAGTIIASAVFLFLFSDIAYRPAPRPPFWGRTASRTIFALNTLNLLVALIRKHRRERQRT